MLSGAYGADSGEIRINGEKAVDDPQPPRRPRAATSRTIYQTLALADNPGRGFSNLFLGRELTSGMGLCGR